MSRKHIITISMIIILVALFSLFGVDSNKENYYKQVELTENNTIVNHVNIPYYDTVLILGLDAVGLKDQTVILGTLPEEVQDLFGGELKAHVRFIDNVFYVYIGKFNRYEVIEILSHEIVHIEQYLSGDLQYIGGILYWYKEPYSLENLDYSIRPWETEAWNKQGYIESEIVKVLY